MIHATPWFSSILKALLGITLSVSSAETIPSKVDLVDLLTSAPIKISFSDAPQATVVIFVSSTCPCSIAHQDELRTLHAAFSKKGFRFIGIHSNANESITAAREHFLNARLPFEVAADRSAAFADLLKALKTPHAYIISPSREILYQGGVDDSHSPQTAKNRFLRDALAAVERGEQPSPSETRTLGCFIKRP